MKKIIIGELIIDISESDFVKLEKVCIYDKTDKERINNLLSEIITKYENVAIRADSVFYTID